MEEDSVSGSWQESGGHGLSSTDEVCVDYMLSMGLIPVSRVPSEGETSKDEVMNHCVQRVCDEKTAHCVFCSPYFCFD